MNSLMAFSERVINSLEQLEERNGKLELEMTLKDERPIGDVLTYDEKGKLIGKERY